MRAPAHIIKVTVLGSVGFQVNITDPITGKYYNGQSERFKTKKEAVTFVEQNNLIIKKRQTIKK